MQPSQNEDVIPAHTKKGCVHQFPCGRIPVFLVQKAGAIQNPTDIDAVDESGVRLSNEVGKLLVGTHLVNGGIQNHLGRRVEHPTADAIMPLDVLEQGEVCHVLVRNTQHDIGGIAVLEDVVVLCAESCEILVHFGSFYHICVNDSSISYLRERAKTQNTKSRANAKASTRLDIFHHYTEGCAVASAAVGDAG